MIFRTDIWRGSEDHVQLEAIAKIVGTENAIFENLLPKMEALPWHILLPFCLRNLADLLEKMLNPDPELRITIEKSLKHKFLVEE